MKNKLLIMTMLFSLILITGCGSNSSNSGGILDSKKTMTCTKETVDEDGYKTTETMEVTYNSSKVLKVKSTNISETDPSFIEFQLNFGNAFAEKFSEIDGIDASYSKVDDNKIKMTMEVEYGKIKPEQIKSVLGDLYSEEDSFYDKSDYTIENFKAENLNGYTCE